jgi:hypothetical protein
MLSLSEIYENMIGSQNEIQEAASMTPDEIKMWISNHYEVPSGSKNYKPLPLGKIKVDRNGDVIVDASSYKSVRLIGDAFTKGFNIKHFMGWLTVNQKSKKITGKIEKIGALQFSNCSFTEFPKMPAEVGYLRISDCANILALKCPKTKVTGDIEIISCMNFETLDNFPKEIEGNVTIWDCPMVKSYGDMSEENKEKLKFTNGFGRPVENPIEKWEKEIKVTVDNSLSFSIMDTVDGEVGAVHKHDIIKLISEYFGVQFDPEDIEIVSVNKGIPTIKIVRSNTDLLLSKSTNIPDLVGKIRIVDYEGSFRIMDAGPKSLEGFDKVFENPNAVVLRLYENSKIRDISFVKHMENCPFNRVYIADCDNLTKLGAFPKIVKDRIWIEKCAKLKSFDCQFPDVVELVKVIHCPKLESLDGISREMKKLECYATGIKTFGNSIEKLDDIDAHNCPNIKSFVGLPEKVDYVVVNKCSNLSSLDGIPKSIYNLSIKGTKLGPFRTKRDLLPHCNVAHTLSK